MSDLQQQVDKPPYFLAEEFEQYHEDNPTADREKLFVDFCAEHDLQPHVVAWLRSYLKLEDPNGGQPA